MGPVFDKVMKYITLYSEMFVMQCMFLISWLCFVRALQFTELIRNCEEAGFPKVTLQKITFQCFTFE